MARRTSDEWLLALVEIETTGLLAGYHEKIDIGIVMTGRNRKAVPG